MTKLKLPMSNFPFCVRLNSQFLCVQVNTLSKFQQGWVYIPEWQHCDVGFSMSMSWNLIYYFASSGGKDQRTFSPLRIASAQRWYTLGCLSVSIILSRIYPVFMLHWWEQTWECLIVIALGNRVPSRSNCLYFDAVIRQKSCQIISFLPKPRGWHPHWTTVLDCPLLVKWQRKTHPVCREENNWERF